MEAEAAEIGESKWEPEEICENWNTEAESERDWNTQSDGVWELHNTRERIERSLKRSSFSAHAVAVNMKIKPDRPFLYNPQTQRKISHEYQLLFVCK